MTRITEFLIRKAAARLTSRLAPPGTHFCLMADVREGRAVPPAGETVSFADLLGHNARIYGEVADDD